MTEPERDNSGAVVHPPLLYLGALAVALVLDWLWPADFIASRNVQYWVGGSVIVASFVLVAPAFRQFFRAGTNIPTNRPSTAVVIGGPYRLSRNPIYVSMTMLIGGIGIAFDSAWVLVLLVPVLIVMRYGVIAREEAYLERKFGDEYLRYKRSVRRWL